MDVSVPRWRVLLDQLSAVLDELAVVPLACLSAAEVREWVEGLGRAGSRLQGLRCVALAEPDWLLLDAVRGKGDVAEVVAADRSVDRRSVAGEVNLGRWLSGFDGFAAAFVDGRLSVDHVRVLKRCHNPRTREYLAEAQDYLIDAAVSCDWLGFQAVVRQWELSCDPDGAEPREQARSRSCRVAKQYDGCWDGRFQLDPVAGHAVATALAREEQALWRADEADESSTRTAGQRRADALVSLITRGATKPNGGGGSAPLVHVVLSERVAADAVARLAADDAVLADLPGRVPLDDSPDGRCHLVDGTPIHPNHALAVLTVATLRRLVLTAESQIIDLGRSVRTFPRTLIQALQARDHGRCAVPGCTSPLAWLQGDHVLAWIRGGRTSLANAQLLCDPHNKHKRDRPPDPPGDHGETATGDEG